MEQNTLQDIGAIVVFGATGDLAMRMLFPSLFFMDQEDFLNADLRIVCSARSELTDEAFKDRLRRDMDERVDGHIDDKTWARFQSRIVYRRTDVTSRKDFDDLRTELDANDHKARLFFLALSPALYGAVCSNMKAAGLIRPGSRVILEKPIGSSLESSREINDCVADAFPEDQIFRIDHYLGKETVQNLLALRFANALFEPLWHANTIDHVQITVSETVGVGGRWSYYNDYGALRDMVQNHMLQLLCLVAMEPPTDLEPESVRNEKVKVLRSLRPLRGKDVELRTVRGQYGPGAIDGQSVPGYAQEEGAEDSHTESFTALRMDIDNWRWAGVPFYLRTGKRLPERRTEIVIQFRHVPHSVFSGTGTDDLIANRLIIHLQPKEEISLLLMNKKPGLSGDGMRLQQLPLNLSLTEAFKSSRPRRRIAYERLLLDALHGNSTLFVRRDETETAWQWIDDVIDGWADFSPKPKTYGAGSWGPSGAFALIERDGRSWYD